MSDSALLIRASAHFATLDDDKNDDTLLEIAVRLLDGTVVASAQGTFGVFGDNSYAAPVDLHIQSSATRGALKTGNVKIAITPSGDDTWRFNVFVDLFFGDGSHLMAKANRLELTEYSREQAIGVE
jgi:hypothetical protein